VESGGNTREESGEQESVVCRKCGQVLPATGVNYHLVRMGYSPAHFPFLKYEKWPLCQECQEIQYRVDRFEKILAIIALVIVFYLMALGFFYLFGI